MAKPASQWRPAVVAERDAVNKKKKKKRGRKKIFSILILFLFFGVEMENKNKKQFFFCNFLFPYRRGYLLFCFYFCISI